MKRLRVPSEKKKVGMATFRFGLFFGSSLTMLGIIFYLVSVLDTRLLDRMRPGLIIYRMLAMGTLLLWYWGVDLWVWTKYRVNYVFIFEFNPRSHIRYQHIFEVRSFRLFKFEFLLAELKFPVTNFPPLLSHILMMTLNFSLSLSSIFHEQI